MRVAMRMSSSTVALRMSLSMQEVLAPVVAVEVEVEVERRGRRRGGGGGEVTGMERVGEVVVEEGVVGGGSHGWGG